MRGPGIWGYAIWARPTPAPSTPASRDFRLLVDLQAVLSWLPAVAPIATTAHAYFEISWATLLRLLLWCRQREHRR